MARAGMKQKNPHLMNKNNNKKWRTVEKHTHTHALKQNKTNKRCGERNGATPNTPRRPSTWEESERESKQSKTKQKETSIERKLNIKTSRENRSTRPTASLPRWIDGEIARSGFPFYFGFGFGFTGIRSGYRVIFKTIWTPTEKENGPVFRSSRFLFVGRHRGRVFVIGDRLPTRRNAPKERNEISKEITFPIYIESTGD